MPQFVQARRPKEKESPLDKITRAVGLAQGLGILGKGEQNTLNELETEKLKELRAKREVLDSPLDKAVKGGPTLREAVAKAKIKKSEGKKKDPSSTQFQAATFGLRVKQAEDVFDTLAQSGFDPTTAKSAVQRSGLFPEVAKSGDAKKLAQAERNFVNAILRRESGAAIADSEFASAELQYFSRVGDTPEVVEQKRNNRQLAFAALKAEAGDAFTRVASEFERTSPKAGKASQGKTAVAGPKGIQPTKEEAMAELRRRGLIQ